MDDFIEDRRIRESVMYILTFGREIVGWIVKWKFANVTKNAHKITNYKLAASKAWVPDLNDHDNQNKDIIRPCCARVSTKTKSVRRQLLKIS